MNSIPPEGEGASKSGLRDPDGLAAGKLFSFLQEQSHVSSTVPRLFSRRFMTVSAFSGLTPTSSRAARKCRRNWSKCASFRP